jgi:hypothetical protein
VVDARRRPDLDEGVDLPGDVAAPGGLAALVVDHRRTDPRAGQPEHGADEVGAVRTVEPGGAQHVGGIRQDRERRSLAGQLGPAIDGPWSRNRVFLIRRGRGAVEDVVGGDVHEGRADGGAGGSEVRDRVAVDGERLVLVRLRVIDRRPGRAVHDDVSPGHRHGLLGRGPVGDVEAVAAERDDGFPGRGQQGDQVGAEHPVRAGDQPPGHRAARGRSGPGAPVARIFMRRSAPCCDRRGRADAPSAPGMRA